MELDFTVNAPTVVLFLAILGALYRFQWWRGRVDEHMTTVRDFMKEVRLDIKKLLGSHTPPTVVGTSPLRLTPLGQEISVALDVSSWAKRAVGLLGDRARGKRPDEIQELCFEYIYDEFRPSAELETAISVNAYDNGVNKEQVLSVLAVVLRDELIGAAESATPSPA